MIQRFSVAKSLLILSLFSIFFIEPSLSQSYMLFGDKTFGGIKKEQNPRLIKIGNDKLLLFGHTNSNDSGDKKSTLCDSTYQYEWDVWILKIDISFNILWEKSLGGQRGDINPFIVSEINDGFLFSCESASDSACDKSSNNKAFPMHSSDYWLCKADSGGNIIWNKTIGGTSMDECPQVVRLSSGNIIVSGISTSPIGADKSVANYGVSADFWIVKTDPFGNKLWDQNYGGTGIEQSLASNFGFGSSILGSQNDCFILAGSTNSPLSGDISDTSRGGMDFWIIKVDSTGNKLWDRRYGGTGDDFVDHIIQTNDNGYILCGQTTSPIGYDVTDTSLGSTDCWIIKLDSLGYKQWDRRYGGIDGDQALFIQEAPDGGYWVSGTSGSPAGYDITEPKYGIAADLWIFKIDNFGNKIWDRRFGGPGNNFGSTFVIMPDSSIFLCGMSEPGISPVKTDSGKGSYDFWLIHFKYSDVAQGAQEITMNSLSVYPNPSSGYFFVENRDNTIGKFQLFSVYGTCIIEKEISTVESRSRINVENLTPGVYIWMYESSLSRKSGKIIIY